MRYERVACACTVPVFKISSVANVIYGNIDLDIVLSLSQGILCAEARDVMGILQFGRLHGTSSGVEICGA